MTAFTPISEITPEAFMAQRDPDEDDLPAEKLPGIHGEGYGTGLPNDGDYSDTELQALGFLAPAPQLDPLVSIARSLERLADYAGQKTWPVEPDTSALAEAQRGLKEAEALLVEADALVQAQVGLIDQVLTIIKPSTSKLANTVRDAIHAFMAGDEPEPVEVPEGTSVPDPTPALSDSPLERYQPADDADVEAWREYARSRGYSGPDLDKANRSQIRTMLGIPHPAATMPGDDTYNPGL